jgi:Tol biopolymer transport system component
VRRGFAVLVLVGLPALVAAGGRIPTTTAQGPPRLIFASDRAPDYNPEVYSLDLGTGARRDLSRDEFSDTVVAVHGRQVIFQSDRSGLALYVARIGSAAPARRLVSLPDGTNSVTASASPDGQKLAVALVLYGKRSVSYVTDLFDRSGRRLARLPRATRVRSSSVWSADGQRLVYAVGPPGDERHLLRVVDARGRLLFSPRGDDALWAEASPRLAIITGTFSNEGSTIVVDEQGRAIRRFAGRAEALSPDGKALVLARPGGKTWLASVDSGRLRLLPGAETASFSPDSQHLELASASGQGALVVSVRAGRVEGHLTAFGPWLGDSRRLVSLGRPGGDSTVMTIGGRVVRRLQLLPAGEFAPTFDVARDANALVYTVQSYLPHQLYEQLAAGGVHQITQGSADHRFPAPSPDGRLIADAEFDTPCGNCVPVRLAVFPADGSAPAQPLPNQAEGNTHPSWSPDGTRLAYGENTAPDILGIFVIGADGSQPLALPAGKGGTEPSWAPDGSAIAASRDGIFVMASDGTNAQQLTGVLPAGSDAAQTHAPAWSPDSRTLAFAGADGLYLIDRDGGNLHRILAIRRISAVAWSPDDAQIAFAATCQTDTLACTNHPANDIWTVAPDGSGLHRVTDDIADDATPAWLPAAG